MLTKINRSGNIKIKIKIEVATNKDEWETKRPGSSGMGTEGN